MDTASTTTDGNLSTGDVAHGIMKISGELREIIYQAVLKGVKVSIDSDGRGQAVYKYSHEGSIMGVCRLFRDEANRYFWENATLIVAAHQEVDPARVANRRSMSFGELTKLVHPQIRLKIKAIRNVKLRDSPYSPYSKTSQHFLDQEADMSLGSPGSQSDVFNEYRHSEFVSPQLPTKFAGLKPYEDNNEIVTLWPSLKTVGFLCDRWIEEKMVVEYDFKPPMPMSHYYQCYTSKGCYTLENLVVEPLGIEAFPYDHAGEASHHHALMQDFTQQRPSELFQEQLGIQMGGKVDWIMERVQSTSIMPWDWGRIDGKVGHVWINFTTDEAFGVIRPKSASIDEEEGFIALSKEEFQGHS